MKENDFQSMRDAMSYAISNPIAETVKEVEAEAETLCAKEKKAATSASTVAVLRCKMTNLTHIYRMLSNIHAALEGVCPGAIVIPAPMSLSEQVAFLIQAEAAEGTSSHAILENLDAAVTKGIDQGFVINSDIHIYVAVGEIAHLDR